MGNKWSENHLDSGMHLLNWTDFRGNDVQRRKWDRIWCRKLQKGIKIPKACHSPWIPLYIWVFHWKNHDFQKLKGQTTCKWPLSFVWSQYDSELKYQCDFSVRRVHFTVSDWKLDTIKREHSRKVKAKIDRFGWWIWIPWTLDKVGTCAWKSLRKLFEHGSKMPS